MDCRSLPEAGTSLARRAFVVALTLCLAACTTYGLIENKPLLPGQADPGYSLGAFASNLDQRSDELTLVVAFSGGGREPRRWPTA